MTKVPVESQKAELAELCAREIMETVPWVTSFWRAAVRDERGPSLTPPQLRAMGFLDRRPGAFLLTVAEYLGVAASTVSALISGLVRRGLVSRMEDSQERRRVVLTLTAAGVRALRQAHQLGRSRIANALSGLSEAEIVEIAEGMRLLRGVFDAPAGSPEERLAPLSGPNGVEGGKDGKRNES